MEGPTMPHVLDSTFAMHNCFQFIKAKALKMVLHSACPLNAALPKEHLVVSSKAFLWTARIRTEKIGPFSLEDYKIIEYTYSILFMEYLKFFSHDVNWKN